jgi:membrane peptidoglycan carboxypeptidase
VNFTERDVAVKSGSTNNSRDAWIMGYAPNLAVGVWVGNNDNAPMNGLSGLIATPMWRQFMDIALAKLEKESFGEPPATDPSIKAVLRGEIFDAGMLLQNIQSGSTTLDLAGVASSIHNILHYVDKRDPLGPYPSNPAADSQYNNWEYAVQKWKEQTYGSLIPVVPAPGEETPEDEEQDEDDEEEDDNNNNRRSNRNND